MLAPWSGLAAAAGAAGLTVPDYVSRLVAAALQAPPTSPEGVAASVSRHVASLSGSTTTHGKCKSEVTAQ